MCIRDRRRTLRLERYSSFSFAVYAVDHGTPSLTGSALVVVVVGDVNDEFPVFARDAYEFVVDENRPEGTDVGTVFAVDGDVASSNGAVRYSIVDAGGGGGGDLLPFSVEAETGNIRTTSPLDRERRSEYRLQVAATDRGEPALTATVEVVVRVADENDNTPVVEFTSSASSSTSAVHAGLLDVDTFVISSSVPRGFVVCRAVAHDADVGVNADVDFRLASDPQLSDVGRDLFVVDPDSGEISVASEFTGRNVVGAGDAREYLLTVRATDGGLSPRSVDAVLRVVVNGSLPYLPSAAGGALLTTGGLVAGNHVTMVVVIAGGSALLTVALVVAIAVVRTRGRKSRRRDVHRSLTVDDVTKSTVTSFETVPLSSTFCTGDGLHPASLPLQSTSPRAALGNGSAHVDDDGFPTLSSKVISTPFTIR